MVLTAYAFCWKINSPQEKKPEKRLKEIFAGVQVTSKLLMLSYWLRSECGTMRIRDLIENELSEIVGWRDSETE